MSSVYFFFIGYSQICSSLEGRTGAGVGGEGVASGAEGVVCGFVKRAPCRVWTMRPLIVLSASGHYLLVWVCVRPSHDA